jgi:hypothetical protein
MLSRADFWVKAYVRAVAAGGAFAAVLRHGDDDRGAVLIAVSALDGTAALYVPAPGYLIPEARAGDRMWTVGLPAGTPEGEVAARLEKEKGFDPDIWIVEVEDRVGRHFLDDWLLPAD